MDSVRKLFRSVSSLFSSTSMPVPAAQQSHVSDTYCDRNASQDMASTVGGTGTSPIAIPDSVRPSIIRGSQVGTFEGDNRHNRCSPSRSRLFDANESQENFQHSPEQVFRTPNVSFERGTREFPQWGEETEVKQIYRPDRNKLGILRARILGMRFFIWHQNILIGRIAIEWGRIIIIHPQVDLHVGVG